MVKEEEGDERSSWEILALLYSIWNDNFWEELESIEESLDYFLQEIDASLIVSVTRIEMIFNRRSKGKFLRIWNLRDYIYYINDALPCLPAQESKG